MWLIFANYPWFSVLVGDFLQPFEIIVDLKGVMQEASMMYINVYQKSRKLHCGAVRAHHHSYQSCCLCQCKRYTHLSVHPKSDLNYYCLQKCDEIIVLHLGYMNYTQYRAAVSFKGLENMTYDIKVKFVVGDRHPQDFPCICYWCCWVCKVFNLFFCFYFPIQWKTYNPTFSQVEIWFRFVFVVLTFMVTVRIVFCPMHKTDFFGQQAE